MCCLATGSAQPPTGEARSRSAWPTRESQTTGSTVVHSGRRVGGNEAGRTTPKCVHRRPASRQFREPPGVCPWPSQQLTDYRASWCRPAGRAQAQTPFPRRISALRGRLQKTGFRQHELVDLVSDQRKSGVAEDLKGLFRAVRNGLSVHGQAGPRND